MAFTDNCDIYSAIHEGGINRVVRHVMRQRPSLFNYGTEGVIKQPKLVCQKIDAHPVVIARGNPLLTEVPPLPILGTVYGLDFCAQFAIAEVDFSPGNVITLPAQLTPPLASQQFAVHGAACAGLGCPPKEIVDLLPPGRPQQGLKDDRGVKIVIPSRELECFCLDAFMVGDFDLIGPAGDQHLLGKLDGLELVDLTPEGLENSIECYVKLFIQLGLLPRLSVPTIRFAQDLMGLATITLSPSPTSPALPNNPAIEDDQTKVFIDLVTGPPGPPKPPGPPEPPTPPPVPGVVRPRTRTGAADATVAVSENAIRELFGALRDGFSFSKSNSGNFGPFSLSYAVAAHLEDGTIELRNDGTIRVRELDVKWDTLRVCFGIDIPQICVGGFCIIPNPFDGCLVRAPRLCAFSANPDISFCLDIGGLITSEVSVTVRPLTKYAVNPARTPAMTDWDAKDAGIPNKWQVLIDPVTLDLDLIDIADIVGDLLEDAVDTAIDGLLGGFPQWAKDLIRAILGPVIDLIRDILDFGDDLGEWLSDKLGVSLELFNFLLTALADYLAAGRPLVQIEDPFPILPATSSLIHVMIPIEFLGVRVNTDEMILEVDIGA